MRSFGCPKCRLSTPTSNLEITHPEIAKEWHPTKNGDLKPTDLTYGSKKQVWWVCSECDKEWKTLVITRSRGSRCPDCAKKQKSMKNLEEEYPNIAKEWHKTKNIGIYLHEVSPGSNKIVWWKCEKCEFEYRKKIQHRTQGSLCPNCKKLERIMNSIVHTHSDLVKEWNTEKNGDLKPEDYSYGSHKKVWWKCEICNCEWEAIIRNRTSNMNKCPDCTQRIRTEKSLAIKNPEIAKEWHPTKNGNLKPTDVTYGARISVWWLCSLCNYEWKTEVNSRNRSGCPNCAKKATPTNNLQAKFPSIAKQWHPTKNGDLKPTDFSYASNKRIWWLCAECNNVLQTQISERTGGSNCPKCVRGLTPSTNLSVSHRELVKEWHPTKNGDLNPSDVTYGSSRIVWWKCLICASEWKAKIHDRVRNYKKCPKCNRNSN